MVGVQIAELLVNCTLPLTKLALEVHQLYLNANEDTAVTQLAIRNYIQEAASRKLVDSEHGTLPPVRTALAVCCHAPQCLLHRLPGSCCLADHHLRGRIVPCRGRRPSGRSGG